MTSPSSDLSAAGSLRRPLRCRACKLEFTPETPRFGRDGNPCPHCGFDNRRRRLPSSDDAADAQQDPADSSSVAGSNIGNDPEYDELDAYDAPVLHRSEDAAGDFNTRGERQNDTADDSPDWESGDLEPEDSEFFAWGGELVDDDEPTIAPPNIGRSGSARHGMKQVDAVRQVDPVRQDDVVRQDDAGEESWVDRPHEGELVLAPEKQSRVRAAEVPQWISSDSDASAAEPSRPRQRGLQRRTPARVRPGKDRIARGQQAERQAERRRKRPKHLHSSPATIRSAISTLLRISRLYRSVAALTLVSTIGWLGWRFWNLYSSGAAAVEGGSASFSELASQALWVVPLTILAVSLLVVASESLVLLVEIRDRLDSDSEN
ncbi:MAG: hypothetical protein AAF958_12195 [Planctomycetota bacterium]